MGELEQSIKKYIESFGETFPKKTYAILYAPEKCFFGLVGKDGKIEIKDHIDKFNLDKVYEARIFNTAAELRWVNNVGERVLSDSDLRNKDNFVEAINQFYLLWGKKHGNASNGWTQFAEARIGAFYVPKEITTEYAQFTAVEYLGEFEDGNVAVIDERLTGIEAYQPKGETENGK